MLYAGLVACGPSGTGCSRASSSLRVADSTTGPPSRVATLIGPLPAHASPAKGERRFNCSKQESPFWKKLRPYRDSIKTNGKKGNKARFYEWDYTHNDIEEYGPAPKYEHQGSINPITGRNYKPPANDPRDLRDKLK